MECRMSKKQKSGWQEQREKIKNTSRGRWLAQGVWAVSGIIGFLVFCLYGSVFFESRFSTLDSVDESNLEAIRNIVLIIAAFLAFPLAVHRTVIADEQLKESEKQNRDGDFQNWIVNLFSSNEGMRHVAVEELWQFAQKYPEDYHVKVMRLFCNFIRNYSDCYSTNDSAFLFSKEEKKIRQNSHPIEDDVSIRMKFIGEKYFENILSMVINKGGHQKNPKQISQEREEGYRMDLSGTNFSFFDLSDGDLTNADLRWTFWADINVKNMKWDNCCIAKALFVPFGHGLDVFKEIEGNPISTPEMRVIYDSKTLSATSSESGKYQFPSEHYGMESSKIRHEEWLYEKRKEARILPPLPQPK